MGKNAVLSIILIALGILLILGQFFNFDFWDSIWMWWPMALVIGGLYYLASPKDTLYSGLVLLAAGLAFQLEKLDLVSSFWSLFLPFMFIIAGVFFALGSKKRSERRRQRGSYQKVAGDRPNPSSDPAYPSHSHSSHEAHGDNRGLDHDISAVFANTQKKIDDKNFSYCSISALMASCEVDLRGCVAESTRVELGLRAIMGNIELVIPANWRLVVRGAPVLGNFEDKTRGRYPEDGRPDVECLVDLECIMGNIEIRD